jgi:hypothetical protein
MKSGETEILETGIEKKRPAFWNRFLETGKSAIAYLCTCSED